MDKYNFIKTKDEETKNKLLKEGFELLFKENDTYVFLNNANLHFGEKSKINYTNQLNI